MISTLTPLLPDTETVRTALSLAYDLIQMAQRIWKIEKHCCSHQHYCSPIFAAKPSFTVYNIGRNDRHT